MPYPVIEQIVEELADMNAVKLWKVQGVKHFERLDVRLEVTHKRGELDNADQN
jgi:hypothetical protein